MKEHPGRAEHLQGLGKGTSVKPTSSPSHPAYSGTPLLIPPGDAVPCLSLQSDPFHTQHPYLIA